MSGSTRRMKRGSRTSLDTVKIGTLVIGSLCKLKTTVTLGDGKRFTWCTYHCTCVFSGAFSTSVSREGGPEK